MFAVSGLCFKVLESDSPGLFGKAVGYANWSVLCLIGHGIGGVAVGAALGSVGGWLSPPPWMAAVLGIACVFWAFQEVRLIPNGLPQWHRQVQRRWVGRLPWMLVALGYGVQLG